FSDKIVLAMYRAKPIERGQSPEFYDMVHDLTMRQNMPMPKLYIIPTDSPNAFATGRDPQHAAVAVTEGILRLLTREELQGVLAHELSHVTNRDILISSVAATMAGAIMMIARFSLFFGYGGRDNDRGGNPVGLLLMAILAPLAATLIQLAISRSREFAADETGVKMVGHPAGLARALEKLEYASKRVPLQANPASAHLFIVKPFSGQSLMHLFSTHPPIPKRIERLRQLYGNF
ncbi:MAG TPA: zinc metalloprotease HtpX, partial [Acidobacteriota bacterium]